jgi:hypothetical protein
LVYADDVTLLGDNIDTIKKNTQTLIDASKEVGLEVNTEDAVVMPVGEPRKRRQDRRHLAAQRRQKEEE